MPSPLDEAAVPAPGWHGFHVCLYGKGGIGKTTQLGMLPAVWGPGLILDIRETEGGTYVLTGAPGIKTIRVRSWEAIDDMYWAIAKGNHGVGGPYNWIAWDSLTGVTELARRHVGHIGDKALAVDPQQITQPGWGKIGSMVAELVWKCKNLPIPVVWTAQERMYDDEPPVGPATSPDAFKRFWPAVSVGARLFADGDGERKMGVEVNTYYSAKHRAVYGRNLPPVIRNANLAQMVAYIVGMPDVPTPEAAPMTTRASSVILG